MQRTRGRGLRGQRGVGYVPHGHWKLLSTVAALTVRGIVTAMSFDGATDTPTFVSFVEHFLTPVLRPGQVVVLDNLAPHKSSRVEALIAAAGARVLYLPPYSPDYNPIENAISKMKTVLRREARWDINGLYESLGHAIGALTPTDAQYFLRHCGYLAMNE